MSLQPEEERHDLSNSLDLNNLDVSQYLQANHFDGYPDLNFSSITDVDEHPSFDHHLFDLNSLEFDQEPSPKLLCGLSEKCDDVNIPSNFGDMSPEEQVNHWTKQIDLMEVKILDQSIEDRVMSVDVQPPTDIRRRYESDGKRQIEKSRCQPMAIKLPDLKRCNLNLDLSIWLQLYLLTTDQNPEKTFYIHPDRLEYHANDVLLSDHGSVRIRLATHDIERGIKQLARISIIKKKLDAYTFELIPFNPLDTESSTTIYKNSTCKSTVAKAKCFRDLYNLTSSCIVCQLVIKQNDTWYNTDITCKTNTMEEKKQPDEKKSNKRDASVDIHKNELSSNKKLKSVSSSGKNLSS